MLFLAWAMPERIALKIGVLRQNRTLKARDFHAICVKMTHSDQIWG
jgi:hypothetical protein